MTFTRQIADSRCLREVRVPASQEVISANQLVLKKSAGSREGRGIEKAAFRRLHWVQIALLVSPSDSNREPAEIKRKLVLGCPSNLGSRGAQTSLRKKSAGSALRSALIRADRGSASTAIVYRLLTPMSDRRLPLPQGDVYSQDELRAWLTETGWWRLT
jgi:hypothetical protein